jgi:cell division protease FtsH
MANDKKSTSNKKPKFSPYCIYGGIIAIFLAMQLFIGGGFQDANITTPSQFLQYLEEGDVEKVEIVNRREAKVYLTREAQDKEIHKKSKPTTLLPTTAKLPNYKFEIGDLQNFEKTFEQTKLDAELNTELIFKTEQNLWGDVLIGILPCVLLIGVWIFIM